MQHISTILHKTLQCTLLACHAGYNIVLLYSVDYCKRLYNVDYSTKLYSVDYCTRLYSVDYCTRHYSVDYSTKLYSVDYWTALLNCFLLITFYLHCTAVLQVWQTCH